MIDHLDRYWDPFLEHVVLTLIPLTIGFAIALTMGLIAHRQKWLITPLTGLTTAIYTSRASRPSCCCCRSPAAATTRR